MNLDTPDEQVAQGWGWRKIVIWEIIQCGALWSPAYSPVAAWHLLHRDFGGESNMHDIIRQPKQLSIPVWV